MQTNMLNGRLAPQQYAPSIPVKSALMPGFRRTKLVEQRQITKIISNAVASDASPSTSKAAKPHHKSKKQHANPLPTPSKHQQTLQRSFTIGGVGLHSGKYAYVRICPAPAGTGRYFIRVPEGTNEGQFNLEKPRSIKEEELELGNVVMTDDENQKQTQQFLEYLQARDYENYEGTFADYTADTIELQEEPQDLPAEDVVDPPDHSNRILANVPAAEEAADDDDARRQWYTELAKDGDSILSPELLLSALEACGIDNARIEIEGGSELPVLDGSSMGWCLELQRVGVVDAVDNSGKTHFRTAPVPREMVTVRDGESFITFYPGTTTRITAGIQHDVPCPANGQWFTFAPETDDHYRWVLSGAHLTIANGDVVDEMMGQGLLRAGPDFCCLVGHDELHWLDESLVRHSDDEGAKSAVAVLMGHLSLLAQPGGSGLPVGHIVAYRPNHALELKFVKMLHAQCIEGWYETL